MCGRASSGAAVRVRLLALDIDGTLLRSDKSLAQRTRGALDRALARGVRLVLVTGRRYPSARRVAAQLGRDVPLIVHNGAMVVEGGVVCRCRPLASATALRAIEVGRAAGLAPVVHCGLKGEGLLLVDAAARATDWSATTWSVRVTRCASWRGSRMRWSSRRSR